MKTHRDIAEQLDLFHSEPLGPGMIFWHPNGWHLFQNVQEHMRSVYQKHGFQEVRTPQFLKKELWEISGHMNMYRDDMFFGGDNGSEQEYALKPMSCPAHILLYKRGVHSYRSLPFKLFEFGLVHRNESSGSLNGVLRLRQFTQDDAHVFCSWSQVEEEIGQFLQRARYVYGAYGYQELEVKVSTQPESALGSDELWRKAEQCLINACQAESFPHEIQVGEGAFYGPKIELALKDALGRVWQCGTIQLDFNLPERFDLGFTNAQGSAEQPVILHQAMYGSIERWIAILLETSQGALPEWIHPMPVAIVPINDSVYDYAEALKVMLEQQQIPTLMDPGNDSIAKKIKRLHKMKIPNIVILGDKEKQSGTVSVRRGQEISTLAWEAFLPFLENKRVSV